MATISASSSAAEFRAIFKKFREAHNAPTQRATATEFKRVFEEFKRADAKSRSTRAATTPRLNVLDAFGLARWELSHSAILAWFLREDAEHEQGPLFVRALLDMLNIPLPTATGYTVQREKPDRVDVSVSLRGQFAVFFENKVDAKERPLQVADLIESLRRTGLSLSIPQENLVAVFLTDDRRAPTPAGADQSGVPVWARSRLEIFSAFSDGATKTRSVMWTPSLGPRSTKFKLWFSDSAHLLLLTARCAPNELMMNRSSLRVKVVRSEDRRHRGGEAWLSSS